jgi:hypothetical protein
MSANTVVQVPFRMSNIHVAYLEGLGLSVTTAPDASRANKHGPAAVERLLSEQAMLAECVKDCGRGAVLVDVYSNADRIVKSAAFLGCEVSIVPLIPVIVPNDRNRQVQASRAGIQYHDTLLSDFVPEFAVDALNFTHSLYYLTPDELCEQMVRLGTYTAYSTQHNFTKASDAICCGTVKYHYTTDGSIKCQADGDETVYQHGAMHWIFGNPIQLSIENKPYHLSWYVVQRLGDTFLYKFEILPGKAEVSPCPLDLDILETQALDDHPIGRSLAFSTYLDKEMRSPTVDLAYVPVTGALFFYGLIGVELGNGEFIAVPRGLVGMLSLAAAGEPRTPALYQLLLAKAKATLPKLNYPTDQAPRTAVFAAVMALIADVEFETATLGTTTRLWARLFHRHTRVLDFEPAYIIGRRATFGLAALTSTVIVPCHYYGVDVLALTAAKALAALALVHPFIALPAAATVASVSYWQVQSIKAHRSAEAQQWLRYRANLMPGPTGRTLTFLKPPSFAAASQPKTTAVALAKGAKIVIATDLHHPDVKALRHIGLKFHGLGFQDATPSYVAKTMDNAIQGLQARSLSYIERAPDAPSWHKLYAKLTAIPGHTGSVLNRFSLGELRNFNEGTFEAWVSRFPTNTQKNLRLARESLKSEPLTKKDLEVTGIIKMEKAGILTVDGGLPSIDTRMVMSCSPRANATFGPRLWQMGCIFKKRFGVGNESGLVWDSGLSAEELGLWYDSAIAAFSTPGKPAKVLVLDRKRFEKNQRRHAQTAYELMLRAAGADASFIEGTRVLHTLTGKVQGMPVTFTSSEPTQLSGGPATSWRNFLENAVGLVHSLGEPGPTRWTAIIKGDDALVVLPNETEVTWEAFEESSAQLGLPVTGVLTTERKFVEFASNLPYPTKDGTVFGPKIGRTLLRFAWTLSNAPPDVYGAATSLYETTNHIPFLRQFIELHRRLSKPMADAPPLFRYKTLAAHAHEACPDTYAYIQERYGLTVSMEESFVERLSTVTSLPATVNWQFIQTLAEIDE